MKTLKLFLITIKITLLMVSTSFAANVNVGYSGGNGFNKFIANDAGTGQVGWSVKVGRFDNSNGLAEIQAFGYNMDWLDHYLVQFGDGTSTTNGGGSDPGTFGDTETASETDFSGDKIYLLAANNATFSSATQYGVFSSNNAAWTFPSSSGAGTTTINADDVNESAFGLVDTNSLNTAANPTNPTTALYWDSNGGAGLGGSGTWSSAYTDTEWTTNSSGESGDGSFAWGADSGSDYLAGAGLKAVFDAADDLGTHAVTVSGTVQAHAGIDFNKEGYTLSGGTAINLAGANAATNTITVASGKTATIETNITGSDGMTKAGDGTLSLNGASIAPDLVISGGTLLISNASSDLGNLTMTGGKLDFDDVTGTFNFGDFVLNGNATIDLGSNASGVKLNFSSFTRTSGELHIWNWSGNYKVGGGADQLIFGGPSLGQTDLEHIFFYHGVNGNGLWGDGRDPWQLGTGEVVPVPEPSTWLGIGGLLLLIGFRERKRLCVLYKNARSLVRKTGN